ncbi:MAG TPA: large conductance mechanosensitive channel protein MscL [Acidobacteriaceae bacterium]|nr:large conductance mechanosensitive channel protein MscL [Acidobacteriaceae bacterium]
MLKGFRQFVLRGNVVDLAVAVVIGAAFTGIVNSLVKDIINPLISATVGQPNFSSMVAHMHGGVITYGNFLNALISFLIVATVIYFGVVLPVSKILARYKPVPPAPPAMKTCPECLSEIPAAAHRCAHCTQAVA